jgi:hypothetical protein
MNLRLRSVSLPALWLMLALAGCQKSADQQSADNSGASDSNAPAQSADKAKAKPKEQAPPPKPIVVPAETVVSVVLDEQVGSKISTPGQEFHATVQSPIEVDGRTAIPKGARATGVVKDAKPAGRFKGGAQLELTLNSITVGGHDYQVQTSAPTQTSTGKGKRTATMVGGGAGGGAVIGGLAGGGKGAIIGGLIGAAAGTAGAGLTGKRDIVLPAETVLTFKLVEPLEIKHRPSSATER